MVCLVVFTLIALLWQLNANSGQNASDLQDESSVSGLVSSESASTLSDVSSLADDRIEVPDLTDVNYEEIAQKAAQEGNYEVLVSSEEFSDTIEEGNIISQVPAFGSAPIQKGSSIAVVVRQQDENVALCRWPYPGSSGRTDYQCRVGACARRAIQRYRSGRLCYWGIGIISLAKH